MTHMGERESGAKGGLITSHVVRDGEGWAWYVTYSTRCLQAGWSPGRSDAEEQSAQAVRGWQVAWRGEPS